MQNKEAICTNVKPMQRAIGIWFKSSNHRILRALYHFLLKLSSLFPPAADSSLQGAWQQQATASPAIGAAAGAVQPVVPAVVSSLASFSSASSTWTPPPQPKSTSAIMQSLQTLQAKQQPVQQGAGGGGTGEDFEQLYVSLGAVVNEGLSAYEKAAALMQPPLLYCPLLLLRAVTLGQNSSQPSPVRVVAATPATPSLFVDRFLGPFVRVLIKLAKEHVHPTTSADASLSPSAFPCSSCVSHSHAFMFIHMYEYYWCAVTEILIMCLELVRSRIANLTPDNRRNLIGTVLGATLLERSNDVRVIKAIIKMLTGWIVTPVCITLYVLMLHSTLNAYLQIT